MNKDLRSPSIKQCHPEHMDTKSDQILGTVSMVPALMHYTV
jgi:hypothetical protein